MTDPRRILGAVILCWIGLVVPAAGQTPSAAGRSETFEEAFLRSVYGIDTGPFSVVMRTVDVSSYALFAAIPAATFVYGHAFDEPELRPVAYRVAVSEAAALVGTMALKYAYGRPRPYTVMDDVASRAIGLDRFLLERDTLSFPSAHAALSFAIATSLSLSYPQWYVIGPVFLWAGAVTTSRLWLGVHYPTDVAAGMLIGTVAGLGVHLLREHITPAWIEKRTPASLRIRVALFI